MVRYTIENYTQEKYYHDLRIVKAVNDAQSENFNDFNCNAKINKGIVKKVLGHDALEIGPDREFLSIEKCTNARINEVLKDVYNAAKERVRDFGNPLDRMLKQNASVSDYWGSCF